MRRWPCWIRTMRHRSPSELLCLRTAEKRRERERQGGWEPGPRTGLSGACRIGSIVASVSFVFSNIWSFCHVTSRSIKHNKCANFTTFASLILHLAVSKVASVSSPRMNPRNFREKRCQSRATPVTSLKLPQVFAQAPRRLGQRMPSCRS